MSSPALGAPDGFPPFPKNSTSEGEEAPYFINARQANQMRKMAITVTT